MRLLVRGSFLAMATLLAVLGELASAAELPKLVVLASAENAGMTSSANMTFIGKVSPPVNTTVEISLYHDLGERNLVILGGVQTSLDAQGQFTLTLNPPSRGWRPGKTLAVVSLDGLPQVQRQIEFEILRLAGSQQGEGSIRLPEFSGVTLDLREHTKGVVPAGKLFRVRGSVGGLAGEGPPVMADLVQDRGAAGKVTHQSGRTLSLPEEGNQFFFELQMEAPARSGHYTLELFGPLRTAIGEMQIYVQGGPS